MNKISTDEQLGLFDAPAPFVRSSETSLDAAERIEPRAATLRGIVLAFLRGRGEFGATDEEMQDQIPMAASTQRPRRVELVDASFVRDSGLRRRTHAGRAAAVWVAVIS